MSKCRTFGFVEFLEVRQLLAGDMTVPAYSSMPEAESVIYLNFLGDSVDRWLGHTNVEIPVFDQDSDPATFSSEELDWIHNTWRAVAEDYAPFNINITTVPPLSNPDHIPRHLTRIDIGGDGSWYSPSAGGVGQLGGFSSSSANDPVLGFVFSEKFYDPRSMGDAVSHEAGHTLGLEHQTKWDGNSKVEEYSRGPNHYTSGIMGYSYGYYHSQWWYGTSTDGPTTFQDDFEVISDNDHVGLKADDVGDTQLTAQAMPLVDDLFFTTGLIGTEQDLDFWSFAAGAGMVTVNVFTGDDYGNLTPLIELRDSSGTLLASVQGGQGANVNQGSAQIQYLAEEVGQYFVVVRSPGRAADSDQEIHSTDANHGYEVGSYTLNASSSVYVPPQISLTRSTINSRSGQTELIASGATIFGTDSSTQHWNRITISVSGGVLGDLLGFATSGKGSEKLYVKSHRELRHGAEYLGTFSATSTQLQISLNYPRETSLCQQLLQQLTLKSKKKTVGSRQCTVTLENTESNTSITAVVTINVS